MQQVTKICIHHFGAPASTPNASMFSFTDEQVNNLHRSRWPDFPSQLNGSFIGYNVIVRKDGSWTQYRLIGEETAAQKGHNFDTVSFCLAGNFSPNSPDRPTWEQKNTLKRLINGLLDKKTELKVKSGTVIDIKPKDIYPHRVLQKNHTECYGSALSDNWGRDLVADRLTYPQAVQMTMADLLQQVLKLLQSRRVGSVDHSCEGSRG